LDEAPLKPRTAIILRAKAWNYREPCTSVKQIQSSFSPPCLTPTMLTTYNGTATTTAPRRHEGHEEQKGSKGAHVAATCALGRVFLPAHF